MTSVEVRAVLIRFAENRTDEAARLPAVMSNPAFKSDPFATIRLHTLNTLATVKHDKAKPAKKTK